MLETETIARIAENGVFALGAFFIIRYFMAQMATKDEQLIGLTRDMLQAIGNNTEALRDLKDQMQRDKISTKEQHEKLMNMMQIASSSIDNNTKQLQVYFEINKK